MPYSISSCRSPSGRALLLLPCFTLACGGGGSSSNGGASATPTGTASGALPDLYKAFANVVSVTVDGSNVVIVSKGLPDHKSPYYGVGNPKYEAYNGSNPNFRAAPNTIIEQQLTFRIPLTPTKLATPSPTPLGPIGVSVNGLPIYNQYAAGNAPLAGEINGFDQYNGHPQQTGQYHYHVEPLWLTKTSRDALIGVLLDGYPVYGPIENGKALASSDLDAAHGHTTPTKEFPGGVYHYHTTSDPPYINGSGFAGAPGTVGR